MFPHLSRALLTAAAAALVVGPVAAEPLRMSVEAFGTSAQVEIRDQPREAAEAAARAALAEIFTLSGLFDPNGEADGGIGGLNKAAGGEIYPLDPRTRELLLRSLQFCIWSTGAYGPLGGELNQLWGDHESGKRTRPDPYDLREAVGTAECNRINLTTAGDSPAATLVQGSRIDTFGLGRGIAVDRAMDVVRSLGVDNAWIEVGNVWRALGPGPEGRGWLASLPPAPGEKEPVDEVWLTDQAMVILSTEPFGGETFPPIVDQRTGVPSRGVIMVVTVTDLAADAEPLATTLFSLGHREGQMRLGTLAPRPSVYWLLGEGQGRPLEATYLWTRLDRVQRRKH